MVSSSSLAMMAVAAASWFPSAAAAETVLQQPEAYQQRLVDWIRSGENGFFHPQVQFQRLGGTGPYAMHALVDMPKGTKLLVVPRSHVIDSFKTHQACVTVARMLDEYEKGDDSFFAPFLSYLFDETSGGTTTGLLPGSWSEEGQNILRAILHGGGDYADWLEPRDFGQPDVFDKCGDNFRADFEDEELEDEDERQHAQDALLFFISRSWTDKMVPVLDMYNHRNGKSLNVESTSAHDIDEDITAFALRDIKAGEQLQNTYTECMDHDCDFGVQKYIFNTANVFHDYGFLEFYPRRWPLNPGGQKVLAEIDEDLETGEKHFQWIFQTPSEETIQWIESQLARLKEIDGPIRKRVSEHKSSDAGGKHNNIEHEADSLLEIFEGYLEVLEMALEHKSDPVGVSFEQFKEDLEAARRGHFEEL